MADKVISVNRTELGHSFLNAMWIAGFLVVLQIAAVTTALLKRTPEAAQPIVTTPTQLRIPKEVTLIPDPELSSTTPIDQIPDNGNGTLAPESTNSLMKQMRAPDLSEISDPVSQIKDPLISRLVDSGVDDRRRGNLKGSLDAFLDADTNFPSHPRILCEIAGTYGEMGKVELAGRFWQRVADMGPIAAGPYHKIATKVLRGENPSIPEIEAGKFLKVGKLKIKKSPGDDSGEWVSLSIPIVGKAGQSISGRDMDLRVYFYDLINGKTPGQTTANISYDFPSKPYNWKENRTEEVEVIYHQPVFTVEQKRNLGERVYFGYVIELYYQNQLQDSVVSSDELSSLRFPASAPVEEPLPPRGPDTSLFPINR